MRKRSKFTDIVQTLVSNMANIEYEGYNVALKMESGVFYMTIKDLTNKVKINTTQRTHAQKVAMLKNAHIIDNEGYFSERYFSAKTVAKDKESGKAITA
jgi:hypothetical protein